MNTRRSKTTLVVINLVLLLALCFTLQTGPSLQARMNESSAWPYEPNEYGLVYLYPRENWGPDKREEMDAVLANAKAKGVTAIVQPFAASLVGTPEASAWLIFLDAAAAAEIDVVAYLWPRTVYPVIDGPFYYDDLKSFLDVVGDHPALIGYIGLHEALEPDQKISDDDLRGFYTEMKNYAPHLLLAHYLGDVVYTEEHRTDGWAFSEGMCDICIIWKYPFTAVSGQPANNQEQVTTVVQTNVDLIPKRDPDAQVWFLGQTFARPTNHQSEFRMPTAAEMEALYLRVMEYPVHGFLWYPWHHTEVYDQVLSDPGLEAQQEMVGHLSDIYLNLTRMYFPVVIYEHN